MSQSHKRPVVAVTQGERAPERRRRELLDSALIEFATRGLGGARVHEIAARTNSNTALLYHYFGSKEQLYIAVLYDIYARIRAEEAKLRLDMLAPVEAIKSLVSFTFKYYLDNPHFVAMINNENLLGGAYLQRSDKAVAVNMPIVATLATLLQRGEAAGQFRSGLDPVDLYLSISALGYLYVSNRHTLGIIFHRDLMRPASVRKRLASMTEMILRYVCD